MTAASGGPPAGIGARRVVWLVSLAALVTFLPSIAAGFVFDDDELIVRNPYAHHFHYLGRCFTTDLWDTPGRLIGDLTAKFYRPLVCAANILDFRIGGGAPWAFHLTNTVAHVGVSALAARVALRWTGSTWAALLGALLFAIHPSRSESVLWISGRTDVFATLFLLVALELIVAGSARKYGLFHFAAAGFALTLALLSKELAVSLPLLVAIDAVLARQTASDPKRARRLTAATLVTLAGSALYLVLRAHTLPIRPPDDGAPTMPLVTRAGYVALSLGYYAARLGFPWPQTFYFRPVAFDGIAPVLPWPFVALGVVALGAIVAWAWIAVAWRRDRAEACMVAVALLLLLPALNVTETGVPTTTADRFLYLPLLPLALAAARHARRGIEHLVPRARLLPLIVSTTTLLFSSVSWVRTLDYASDESMWRHELEVRPDNPTALGRLGQALASQGDLVEAEALLRHALSPDALRYRLLASPSLYYLGLLEIEGPRIADGDFAALSSLLGETLAVVDGHLPDPGRRAPSLDLPSPPLDPHFRIHAENARAHLLLASTVLASRLPNDARTRAVARRIEPDAPLDAHARFNLALALGRAADYDAARSELVRAVAADATAPASTTSMGVVTAAAALDRALSRVADLRADASRLPEPASSVVRARAFLELGAYLRAARVLRAAHTAYPDDRDVRAAFFEALVAARLDADALSLAGEMPGTDPATRVAEARRGLSARVLGAREPPRDAPWWRKDTDPE